MIKDPAFLFYSSDFLTGTILMTNEQIGKYIKLLCVEHQKGRLLKEDMINICKTYDKTIFDKFKIDENGLYYNERLEFETNKRKNYSDSRRANRTGSKNNTCKTYVVHMENENVIENINNYITLNNYSNKLSNIIKQWLEYKLERKENYKQQGFTSLLTQIKNNIEKQGEEMVIEVIVNSMANNYAGIIFNKFKEQSSKSYQSKRMEEQEKAKQEFLKGKK